VAVRRRPEQDEVFVRRRAAEVWQHRWQDDATVVVDAGLPIADVLDEARRAVWEHL
jgi:hypothetical protein